MPPTPLFTRTPEGGVVELDPDKLLKVGEVAQMTSLSRSSIYRAMKAGELVSVKIGGCRRISVRELSIFLDRARVK